MCFLSVYRLKYLVSVGIVVTLLIGIGLLYVLVYSFMISSITIQVQSDFRTLLISAFLSTSMLMILSSLAGIYGSVCLIEALSAKGTSSWCSTRSLCCSTWSRSCFWVFSLWTRPSSLSLSARVPSWASTSWLCTTAVICYARVTVSATILTVLAIASKVQKDINSFE